LGGLLFSILALRAKRKQKTVFWWFLLSLIFIAIFGFLSYTLVLTSSPTKDSSYYYLGMVSLVSNSIALIILIATLFSKNSNDKVK
jgi:heme A synthase